MVVVAAFPTVHEAQFAKSALDAAGIAAALQTRADGVSVVVDQEHAEEAREFFAAVSTPERSDDNVRTEGDVRDADRTQTIAVTHSRSLWAPILWGLPAWLLIAFQASQSSDLWRTRGFLAPVLDVVGTMMLVTALFSPLVVPLSSVAYVVSLMRRLEPNWHPVAYLSLLVYSIGVISGLVLSLQVFDAMW